jgi:hypothetical protein
MRKTGLRSEFRQDDNVGGKDDGVWGGGEGRQRQEQATAKNRSRSFASLQDDNIGGKDDGVWGGGEGRQRQEQATAKTEADPSLRSRMTMLVGRMTVSGVVEKDGNGKNRL